MRSLCLLHGRTDGNLYKVYMKKYGTIEALQSAHDVSHIRACEMYDEFRQALCDNEKGYEGALEICEDFGLEPDYLVGVLL